MHSFVSTITQLILVSNKSYNERNHDIIQPKSIIIQVLRVSYIILKKQIQVKQTYQIVQTIIQCMSFGCLATIECFMVVSISDKFDINVVNSKTYIARYQIQHYVRLKTDNIAFQPDEHEVAHYVAGTLYVVVTDQQVVLYMDGQMTLSGRRGPSKC